MRSGSSEWPLVLFTLLIQMSVGFFIVLSFFYDKIFIKGSGFLTREISGKMFLIIWPVIFLALIISFFHLGSPKNAVYVLSNISQSWLSREILCTIIFSALAFISSILLYKEIFPVQIRHLVLALCAIAGLILVFVMSKLYMIETVPAWNSYNTPFSFYLTAMILGISSFLAILTFLLQQNQQNIFFSIPTGSAAKMLLGFCIILVLVEFAGWILHLRLLSSGTGASKESFHFIIINHHLFFTIRIVFSALLLIILSYALYGLSKNSDETKLIYLSYFLIILSEFTGRYLFYTMYARNGV